MLKIKFHRLVTFHNLTSLIININVFCCVINSKSPRLAERGKIKCDAYWPLEPLETCDYGKIKVVNLGIANKGDYQITLLEATNREVITVRQMVKVTVKLLLMSAITIIIYKYFTYLFL